MFNAKRLPERGREVVTGDSLFLARHRRNLRGTVVDYHVDGCGDEYVVLETEQGTFMTLPELLAA